MELRCLRKGSVSYGHMVICCVCKDHFSLPKSKITVDHVFCHNPRATKVRCQCLRRERNHICYLPDSVIIGSSAIKMLFEDMKRSVLKCSKIINLSDNSVRIKRLAKEPGALPRRPLKHVKIHNRCQSCYIRSRSIAIEVYSYIKAGNYFYILRHNACLSLLLELLAR